MSSSSRLLPFSPSNRAARANTASSSRLSTPDPSPAISGRRRTHSEANTDSENAPPPATVIPGRKRRKKDGVAGQTDEQVWDLTDVEICDASKATWKSEAYDHYNLSLRRDRTQRILYFRFQCKFGHPSHSAIERRRELLKTCGGPIEYWYRQEELTPSLARMGSDYCSAPATSVDGERSFSVGRRKLNFMQFNTSDQTFRSSMAVGSWDGTPFFSTLEPAIQILQQAMDGGEGDDDEGDSNQ